MAPDAPEDYAARPRPPEEPAAALVGRLLDVRFALLQDVLPRPAKERGLDRVRVLDENPPLFCVTERLPDGDLVTTTVPVTLDPEYPLRPVCDLCAGACTHGLAAVDELLDWLFDVDHQRRQEVLQVAGQAPWRRWLETLDEALLALEDDTERRAAARLWWSVDLEAETIVPFVERGNKRGGRSAPKRVRLEAVAEEVMPSPLDRVAIAAARLLKAERRAAQREGRGRAQFIEALSALVGHPRVSVGAPGGTPWRVESAPVRFEVHREGEGLGLTVAAGQVDLQPEDLAGGRPRARTLLFVQDEARRLQLAHIEPPLARLLGQWAKSAVAVPTEAQPELMDRLSRAAQHLEVQAGDHVRELEVPARLDLVALLSPLPKGGLHVELKCRPLVGGPLLTPSMGPEAVLSSTPERQILRAKRDLYAELEAGRALFEDHALIEDEARPFVATVEALGPAVDLAKALRADPRVECQWPTEAWHPPLEVGTERLNLSIRVKRDWFDVRGGVEIDGQRVELAVLVEAARRDRGYVPLDDGRFLELQAQLRGRLEALARHLDRRAGGLRLLPSGIEEARALGDEAARFEAHDAWVDLMRRIDEAARTEPALPSGMQDVLRPYQADGYRWLARLTSWGAGAVLADDMGLGKTVQAIALLRSRAPSGPQLVIAPTSVGFNWRRELARFAPDLEVHAYAGPSRDRVRDHARPGVVWVTSYGVVQRDVTVLEGLRFATVVIDEAQAIKNPRSQRARAVRALRRDAAVALTGTPVENHPAEMWALFEAVFPGLLGSWDSFRTRFLATGNEEHQAFGTGALGEVVKPYVLRRTKAQVAQHLPARTEITVDVTLSHRERAMYDDARLAAVAEMGKREVVEQTHLHLQVFSALTRLRQLACNPRLADPRSRVPSSKLERLLQILHDLVEEGRRALVFSHFTRHLDLVQEALEDRGLPLSRLDGRTPAAARAQAVDDFQAGAQPIFLISTKAGGTGLNLTAADTVVHLDPWWNPAAEDQATDRAHRLGQTQPVTVIRLVTRDTIEQHMQQMNKDKRDLVGELLEGTEVAGKLSSEALMALIRA